MHFMMSTVIDHVGRYLKKAVEKALYLKKKNTWTLLFVCTDMHLSLIPCSMSFFKHFQMLLTCWVTWGSFPCLNHSLPTYITEILITLQICYENQTG